MIKISNRVEITPTFVKLIKQFYLRRYQSALERSRYQNEDPGELERCRRIVQDPAYFDMELTRLKTLNYHRFDADGDTMIAYTLPIQIFEKSNTRGECGKYLLGEYKVMFDVSKKIVPDNIRMIPMRQPDTEDRHPHHRAQYTCWGSFGGLISMTCSTGDIPEVFRTLSIFLSTYNAASPLVHIHSIPFATRTAL